MRKEERKETANKGFSLVELIIVVAIMAVLVGILAPQYLRYVERSRLTKDNSAIDTVKTAIEVALTDEAIYSAVAGAANNPVVTISSTGGTWTNGVNLLSDEVKKTIDVADVKLSSKTYIGAAAAPSIKVDKSTMKVTIENQITTPTE